MESEAESQAALGVMLQWMQAEEAKLLHQMRDGETRIGLRLLQVFLQGTWRPE